VSRDESWLVTGALGCIGSWVVRTLVDEGVRVTTFDLQTDGHRLDLVVGADRLRRVSRLEGDLREVESVRTAFDTCAPTHVVHLAALQVPFCKADPVLGAQVNVVGTVNVFEAAADRADVQGLVYASSVGAYDATDDPMDSRGGELSGWPSTLYGVYKRANEATAQVYWADRGLASVGLRPHTVYGPGRDQGLTSQPTAAMAAAARGQGFEIAFGGRLSMQYAGDVAGDFIAAARAGAAGAPVVNLAGTVTHMADVVAAIVSAAPEVADRISFADAELPFPAEIPVDNDVFVPAGRTSLSDGVRASVEHFRAGAVG
jgi:nucleoside-diphosphate-sugar epimerase